MNDRLSKWRSGLERTRKSTFGRIANLIGVSEINNDTWDELEAMLIQADLGVETATSILEEIKIPAQTEGWTKAEELKDALRKALQERLSAPTELIFNPDGPTIVLIVGVNGSGKTTTAAKLGAHYQQAGKQVALAAADTFRAAAIEQLQSWGERLDLRVIAGQPEGDPGAITYDAVQSAISRKDDLLLVDTAGRLHTRFNLMEELKKVQRVSGKALEGAPHAVWLVMDATTGQNALQQAKAFKEAVDVTGVILAKLDSSARGGMAFAIQEILGLPILFAGLGEKPEDLTVFDPDAFIESILADFD
ncbi:MAG: signal recognition particle-docking protein FtsY [Chloroflexi bacterium]|nr:MAG: signal recognition particle-docking protein FtsY [Chloroflexota bacterium]MBL1193558.1 signal recognition particle-docking protein FtsY [Chloroflexota bacterium]NOH10849.1 signal recognition particle-docking protein FtsY [Chloroflexota bacterium]